MEKINNNQLKKVRGGMEGALSSAEMNDTLASFGLAVRAGDLGTVVDGVARFNFLMLEILPPAARDHIKARALMV